MYLIILLKQKGVLLTEAEVGVRVEGVRRGLKRDGEE